jgi:membrane protease YdiL (CAAX protease family)
LLTLALLCGTFVLYVRAVRHGARFLPAQRHRAVPWSGAEVFLVVLVYFFVPALIALALNQTAVLETLYGNAFHAKAAEDSGSASSRDFITTRISFWAPTLALPIELAALLLIFFLVSGTQLYQLGITSYRWAANAYLGARSWLIWTPVVIAVNFVAVLVFRLITGHVPAEHPVTNLVEGSPLVVDWILLITLPIVVAPVLEELIFRGILQSWFSRRPWGGDAAMAAAFAVSLIPCFSAFAKAREQQDLWLFLETTPPAFFVLAMVPGYLLVEHWGRRFFPKIWWHGTNSLRSAPASPVPLVDLLGSSHTMTPELDVFWPRAQEPAGPTQRNVLRAWYGTALLFAAVHSDVWPSPVALFVLALPLGWLAYRTQSLVGPVVFHALFNSIACVDLILRHVPSPW